MPLTVDGLNAALLPRLPELMLEWLPGGKFLGREYICADLNGWPGDAIKVNLDKGTGSNFVTNEAYPDPIALYAASHGIGLPDAQRQLAIRVDYDLEPSNVPVKIDRLHVEVTPDDE